MINWWLAVPFAALTVAIYVTSAVIGSRRGYRHGMKAFEVEYRKIQADHSVVVAKADRMEYERDEARTQRDRLNIENVQIVEDSNKIAKKWFELNAQNADLREALQEAQAEIKALHMQTVEIEEIKPIKRPPRKKAGQP